MGLVKTEFVDRYVIKHDSINNTFDLQVPVNEYTGTEKLDSVELSYSHLVEGYLLGSTYGIKYLNTTTETTINTTQYKNRLFDIFATAGTRLNFGDNAEFTTGVELVTKKWQVGYQFHIQPKHPLTNKTETYHGVTMGIRLFGI